MTGSGPAHIAVNRRAVLSGLKRADLVTEIGVGRKRSRGGRNVTWRRKIEWVDAPPGPGAARSSERGAALAEAALVLPIMLIVLFAIAEFGIAFNRAQAIEAAAREGARLASISSTTAADVNARVATSLAGVALNSGPMVTISPSVCAGREGQSVTVTVTGTDVVTVPLVNSWTLNLNGTAVFRCEA